MPTYRGELITQPEAMAKLEQLQRLEELQGDEIAWQLNPEELDCLRFGDRPADWLGEEAEYVSGILKEFGF